MASIKITKSMLEEIKSTRKEKKITQKEMADYLEISLTKYQRFESFSYETFDEKSLLKILEKLEISPDEYNINDVKPTIKISCRISPEYYNYLKTLQLNHQFASFSETINYVIGDYFLNLNLANTKYEMEDLIKKVILSSWASTVKEQNIDIKSNQKFLDYILETYDIDEETERKNFKTNEIIRKNRSKW